MADTQQKKQRYEGCESRIYLLGIGLVFVYSILGIRLWHLQIVQGEHFRSRADDQRLYPQRLQAPRGPIFGSDGQVLADTRSAFDLMFVPGECPPDEWESVCMRLEKLLDINGAALYQKVQENRKQPATQIPIKQDISKTKLALVEENSLALPGVFPVVRPQRRYSGKTGGQILGYLSEVNAKEVEKGYRMGDIIGRTGLEAIYDELLRGEDGQMVVSVYSSRGPQLRTDEFGVPRIQFDSKGRSLAEEKELRREPKRGQELHITLDMGLQAKCEELLAGEIGAIAVLDANTGAVLAMASTPSYDPSIFVTKGHSEERRAALELDITKEKDKLHPMKNRCYENHYPAGSTFKVMLACAALEEGVIKPHTSYGCSGVFRKASVGRPFNCWTYNRGGHGSVDVVEALSRSCDVFFYNVGLELGEAKIKEWSTRMGLGVVTGIDLPGELPGNIPCAASKRALMQAKFPDRPGEWKWRPSDTVNVSIGQGEVLVTPLQNAVMMAAIINGGRRVTPYLNKDRPTQPSEPFLSPETIRIVTQGMQQCVEDTVFPRGTGIEARVKGVTVLGKTGTAQVAPNSVTKKYGHESKIPYKLRDHALFVAGVPDRDPPIAISIIIEHGLHGSSAAAPLAKPIIEYFYNIQPEAATTKVAKASMPPSGDR